MRSLHGMSLLSLLTPLPFRAAFGCKCIREDCINFSTTLHLKKTSLCNDHYRPPVVDRALIKRLLVDLIYELVG